MLIWKFRFCFIYTVFVFGAISVRNGECAENQDLAVHLPENENFPFNVAIAFEKSKNLSSNIITYEYGCAGVLIAKQFVLTAAHCVDTSRPVAVLLGLPQTYDERGNSNSIVVDVKNVTIHPNYSSYQTEHQIRNDIVVIELENDVSFSKNIYPICLPTATDNPTEGSVLFGSGIRRDENRKVRTDILLTGTAKIEPNSKCNEVPNIDDTHLCVLDSDEICETISGSALFSIINDTETGNCKHQLIGIKIAGFPCHHSKLRIYNKIAAYSDFIEKTMLQKRK